MLSTKIFLTLTQTCWKFWLQTLKYYHIISCGTECRFRGIKICAVYCVKLDVFTSFWWKNTEKKFRTEFLKFSKKIQKFWIQKKNLTNKISVPLQLSDEYMICDASNNDITRLKLKKNRFSFGICRKFPKIGEK